MATGHLEDRDPYIEIRLSGTREHPLQPLTCLIDTGFTGAIQVPEASAPAYNLKQNTTIEMFYGDPNPVIRPAGLGIAEIDGLQRDVAVVIGPPGTYPLLGIMFLKAFSLRLTIDPLNNLVELVPSARVRLLPE